MGSILNLLVKLCICNYIPNAQYYKQKKQHQIVDFKIKRHRLIALTLTFQNTSCAIKPSPHRNKDWFLKNETFLELGGGVGGGYSINVITIKSGRQIRQ